MAYLHTDLKSTIIDGATTGHNSDHLQIHNFINTSEDERKTLINVKDYGAVGDGTTNDTQAIINARNAVIAANDVSFGGNQSLQYELFFPAGNYLVQSANVLMNYDGTPGPVERGYGIRGVGKRRSIITFNAGAGNLGTFNGRVKTFRVEGLTLHSSNAAQTAFYFYSQTDDALNDRWSNADMIFKDVELSGAWTRGFYFDGSVTYADGNGDVHWEHLSTNPGTTFSQAVIEIGSANLADVFKNYMLTFPNIDIASGDFIRIPSGGQLSIVGGIARITGTNTDTLFTLGNSQNTSTGPVSFSCAFFESELQSVNHKLLKHYWGGDARIGFSGYTDSYNPVATHETVEIFGNPGGSAEFGVVSFNLSELKGYHFVSGNVPQDKGVINYTSCVFSNFESVEPVSTTAAATGPLQYTSGNIIPAHSFIDCRGIQKTFLPKRLPAGLQDLANVKTTPAAADGQTVVFNQQSNLWEPIKNVITEANSPTVPPAYDGQIHFKTTAPATLSVGYNGAWLALGATTPVEPFTWPDATTVGLSNPGALTDYAGGARQGSQSTETVLAPGDYSDTTFYGNFRLAAAGNYTFTNCKFVEAYKINLWIQTATNVTITNCEFDGEDGLYPDDPGGHLGRFLAIWADPVNVTVEDCYFHGLRANDWKLDAINIGTETGTVLIKNNYFEELWGDGVINTESLYATPTPGNTQAPDPAGAVTLGFQFYVTAESAVQKLRFYKVLGDTQTSRQFGIWDDAGVVYTGTTSGETASGWQDIDIANQHIHLDANTRYTVGVYFADAHYSYDGGGFSSQQGGTLLVAPPNSDATYDNGVFDQSGGGFVKPTSSASSTTYYIDLEVGEMDSGAYTDGIQIGGPLEDITIIDNHFNMVPNLADGMCIIQADLGPSYQPSTPATWVINRNKFDNCSFALQFFSEKGYDPWAPAMYTLATQSWIDGLQFTNNEIGQATFQRPFATNYLDQCGLDELGDEICGYHVSDITWSGNYYKDTNWFADGTVVAAPTGNSPTGGGGGPTPPTGWPTLETTGLNVDGINPASLTVTAGTTDLAPGSYSNRYFTGTVRLVQTNSTWTFTNCMFAESGAWKIYMPDIATGNTLTVDKCEFTGPVQNAFIKVDAGDASLSVTRSSFHNEPSGNDGIVFSGDVLLIDGCYFDNFYCDGTVYDCADPHTDQVQFGAQDFTDCWIKNNFFRVGSVDSSGSPWGVAIFHDPTWWTVIGTTFTPTRFTIENNYFNYMHKSLAMSQVESAFNNLVLQNNVFGNTWHPFLEANLGISFNADNYPGVVWTGNMHDQDEDGTGDVVMGPGYVS